MFRSDYGSSLLISSVFILEGLKHCVAICTLLFSKHHVVFDMDQGDSNALGVASCCVRLQDDKAVMNL